MLATMFRPALGVLLVGALAPASAIADARTGGRVVRVERVRPAATIPRMCMAISADRMICLGKPAPDERVDLFDTEKGKRVGQLKVEAASDFVGFRGCPGHAPVVFEVRGSLVSGTPDLLDGSRQVVGLRHAAVDSSSRLVKRQPSPSGKPDRQVEMAVDFEGDGTTDFVLEHYTCGDRASARMATTCFDTYVERRGKLELVQSERLQICP